jgi:pimeloyl-ACP methyl ester carboxylesterase
MRKPLFAYLLVMVAGCAMAAKRYNAQHPPLPPTVPPRAVVFVANGAGDFRTITASLSEVVAERRVPLPVETVTWSRGSGRYVADQIDHANHLAEGRRLACQVADYRQACPDRKVYLIGYSAGCAVILAATEQLPPDSVERLILLAPSVCVCYDLRPALRGARGIDVFYSAEDRWVLGAGTLIVGSSDRGCRTAAGQYGFKPVVESVGDGELYAKLRQHPWEPGVQWTGNDGGHYGYNRTDFLGAYVLPLLAGD